MDITAEEQQPVDIQGLVSLMEFAKVDGDISALLDDETVAKVTSQVLDTYEQDKISREDLSTFAEAAL